MDVKRAPILFDLIIRFLTLEPVFAILIIRKGITNMTNEVNINPMFNSM